MKSERWIYSLGILTVLFLMAFENIFNLRKEQTSLDLPLKNIKELAVNFDCDQRPVSLPVSRSSILIPYHFEV
jgi:hypothetical protein